MSKRSREDLSALKSARHQESHHSTEQPPDGSAKSLQSHKPSPAPIQVEPSPPTSTPPPAVVGVPRSSQHPHYRHYWPQPVARQPQYYSPQQPQYYSLQRPQYYSPPRHYPPRQPRYYYSPQQQPISPPIQRQPVHYYHQPMVGSDWLAGRFESYLQHASSFRVVQREDILKVVIGLDQPNQYTVRDQAGNEVFFVGEEAHWCGPQSCCAVSLVAQDTAGASVLVMTSGGGGCPCCCGACCRYTLTVATSSGQLLGTVEEEFALCTPLFAIKNAAGLTVLRIRGSGKVVCCGGRVVFNVQTLQGATVGTIVRERVPFTRFTDADTFRISFPPDLDPAAKAVCLGALFMIDYKYFEAPPRPTD